MEYLAKEFDSEANQWYDRANITVPNWGMTYPVKKQLDFVLRDVAATADNDNNNNNNNNNDGNSYDEGRNSPRKRDLGYDLFNTVIESVNSAAGYYDKLIRTFVKLGYTENKDIVSAPYDWRNQPNEEWMARAKEQVERTYASNSNTPVVLVAHSYGNIMAYLFLIRQTPEWKKKYIHHYVAASPAYMGSPKAFVLGLTYTIFDVSPEVPVYVESMGKPFRSIPSLYTLMPYPKAYDRDRNILEVPGRNYSFEEIPEVFEEIGIKDFAEKWNVSRWMMSAHNEEYSIPPGVSTTIFYTTSRKSTYYKVRCTKTLAELKGLKDWVGSGLCSVVFKEGDGTITEDALTFVYSKWAQKGSECKLAEISNADHTTLISSSGFLESLGSILGVEDVSKILSYEMSFTKTAKMFGGFIGITFIATFVVMFGLAFITPGCCCCCKDRRCGNTARVLAITAILAIGAIALIIVSFSLNWLYVDYNEEVVRLGLRKYTLYDDKHPISSLEDCQSCDGIYSVGSHVICWGIVTAALMLVSLVLAVINSIRHACKPKYKLNSDIEKGSMPFYMASLGLSIASTVALGITAYAYLYKVSKLSDDKYTKHFSQGFPCYISAVIPIIAMAILYAFELIISYKKAEIKDDFVKMETIRADTQHIDDSRQEYEDIFN